MDFIQAYAKEIAALLVPVFNFVFGFFLRREARLVWATRHAFTHLVQQPFLDEHGKQIAPTQTVSTASVGIHNVGKKAATNVELVFNWKPQSINFWPARLYEDTTMQDGRYVVKFASLAAGEVIGFELLVVNGALPNLSTVRSDESTAAQIRMIPQEVLPAWKLRLAGFLIVAGLAVTGYAAVAGAQWIYGRIAQTNHTG